LSAFASLCRMPRCPNPPQWNGRCGSHGGRPPVVEVRPARPAPASSRVPAELERFIAVAAEACGLSPETLRSREHAHVRARWAAWFVARHDLRASFPAIGRAFDRDHATVFAALKNVDDDGVLVRKVRTAWRERTPPTEQAPSARPKGTT
jgi:hypothetical protein